MPLTGEAKKLYQREYMRRQRAGLPTRAPPKPKGKCCSLCGQPPNQEHRDRERARGAHLRDLRRGGCCSDRRGEGERCSVSSHADAPRRRTETPGATEQGDHPLARPGRRDGPVYRRSQFMGACNRSSARSISRRRGGLSSALASTRTSSLSRRSIRSAARPTCRSRFLR